MLKSRELIDDALTSSVSSSIEDAKAELLNGELYNVIRVVIVTQPKAPLLKPSLE